MAYNLAERRLYKSSECWLRCNTNITYWVINIVASITLTEVWFCDRLERQPFTTEGTTMIILQRRKKEGKHLNWQLIQKDKHGNESLLALLEYRRSGRELLAVFKQLGAIVEDETTGGSYEHL